MDDEFEYFPTDITRKICCTLPMDFNFSRDFLSYILNRSTSGISIDKIIAKDPFCYVCCFFMRACKSPFTVPFCFYY